MRHWRDLLVGILLAIAAGLASYYGASLINPVVLQAPDLWFQSDLPRVYADMTDRWFIHNQTSVHPLFLLATCPPTYALQRAFGIDALTAVRLIISMLASLWMAAVFLLLRLIGCRRFDATLFSLLCGASASALFWFVVPETFGFGSVSIVVALILVAVAERTTPSQWWYIIVNALTGSFTITNWMAGILATWSRYNWRRSLQITVAAVCLLMVLWGVQKSIFPSARFILENRGDTTFLLNNPPLSTMVAFAFHAMIMPAITIRPNEFVPEQPYMSTQLSLPGSGSRWGMIAVGLWTALLALGLWSWRAISVHRHFRFVLLSLLMGQLILHLLYGDETFLYSLHYTPLLVVLAAISTLTKARVAGRLLAGGLLLTVGFNNGLQFEKALALASEHLSEHLKVLDQMSRRQTDIWPRGMGHVVLAAPGTIDVDKAYHEPGGSFSPGVGTFGVSVWVVDQNGNPIATSETLPLNEITQTFEDTMDKDRPAIMTHTRYYRAIWSVCGPGCWRLRLSPFSRDRTIVMIRSVGPAGGPIHSLNWNGSRLLINERWSVGIEPVPGVVSLGEEGSGAWFPQASSATHLIHDSGWGYARIELTGPARTQGDEWEVLVRDTRVTLNARPVVFQASSRLHVDVPDSRFMTSLRAQLLHLAMGLVGHETWPGDPLSFRAPALRDGAYTIVALARAGQLHAAKALAQFMAEHDFYGELGAEADAPGLAIWALEETAKYARDTEYDQWLWPHVRRKAKLITRMRTTHHPIRVLLNGPFPQLGDFPKFAYAWNFDLVAEAARDGFIVGRALGAWPLSYVNATSYRGLLHAAALADRVGRPEEAMRYRIDAASLKQAWERQFASAPNGSNGRGTYMNAFWPTGIASSSQDKLRSALEARWNQLREQTGGFKALPSRTSLELNHAHQWLWLGEPGYVWPILEWLLEQQASSGLYTWEEGEAKVYRTMLSRWEGIRTLQYPYVTPLYWTAAEMALLQLDMLAYAEQDALEPTIVIGAGIPSAWLAHPMKVTGFPLPSGPLDWVWDGQRLTIVFPEKPVKVRLGPAFPSGTKVHVHVR